jgi:hypothetical protein
VGGHPKDTIQFAGQRGVILQRDTLNGAMNLRSLGRTHLVSLIGPESGASKRVAEKVGMLPEKEIDRRGKRIQVDGIAR